MTGVPNCFAYVNNLRKFLHLSVLFLILISSFFLVLPTIHHHINDPNAIVYFNNDEGYQMDLIWSYYSGEIRPSYAGNLDYGLEMVYIADFCRLFLSRFIDFTPGLLVVIMRWLHLLGWLSALIAFWRMVGCHFNRGWQRSAATLLLAVHPAFAYFSINNKPDFLVFLFMIIGLDYSLRLVERPPQGRPSKKVLLISVASAAIAVIIKFAGFYLLPAIVAALYLGKGGKGGVIPSRRRGIFLREEGMTHKVLSDVFIVFAIFSAAMSIFGFRWFLTPAHFINTYVQNGLDFSGGFMIKDISDLAGFVKAYGLILMKRFVSFDMIILFLFGIYLFMEVFFKKEGLSFKPDQTKKRLVLMIYLVPFLLSMFTPGRFTVYHALPFFAAIYILIFEGIGMMMFMLCDYQVAKGLTKIALTLLVLSDISVNARKTVNERVSQFHQREDVSFEISEWWQRQIPPEEKVVTDHMTRVYVPFTHKNITVFRGYQTDRIEQLQSIIKESRPRYLYYNEGPSGGEAFPSIGEMIPGQKVRLVRLFESKRRPPQRRKHQRYKGDRFFIYELIY